MTQLVGEVLAVQVREPEFKAQKLHKEIGVCGTCLQFQRWMWKKDIMVRF